MKKVLLSFFVVVLAAVCAVSQTTILDFETPATSTTFQYFGSSLEPTLTQIVANPAVGGINTSANVAQYTKPAGAQTWAGAFSNPNPTTAITVTGGALIKVKVRMNHIGNLAVKLEQSNSGQPDWIKIVANTQVNQWQELTFNCALPSDEGPNQVPTGTFARLVLFFDFGTGGGGADVTSHFDDVIVSGGAPPPATFPVNFTVNMSNYGGTFNTVFVSGTLNGWSGNANPLTNMGGGLWSGTINLPAGSYEYKFTIDNWAQQESFAPGAPCTVTNSGFTNRALTVAGPTTTINYCWNSCDICSSVQTVNFSVNMNNYTGPAYTTVYVSGSFNGWAGGANPLSDPDGDKIWTGTLNLANGSYEYKFQIDQWAAFEQFAGGEPCTVTNSGFTNRALTVVGATSTPVFCWNSCFVCSVPDPVVSFSVDMNGYTGPAFTTVYVSGLFNGWSGNSNPLSDPNADGVWTGNVSMPAGIYEYKVTLDNWANQEQFLGTEECTMTTGPFTNRKLTVPSGTAFTVPKFCFNSCYLCGERIWLTFKLGMGNVVPNPAGVWLAGGGNFENPGGRYKMNDSNNDGIWEILVPRKTGFSSFFTFANGPCADYSCKENLAGFPCGDPANYNDRFLPAQTADYLFGSCFGQCSTNPQCTYPALAPVFATTNVSCPGGNNGTITTTVTGGSTFYTYNWGGGITTKNRTGLAAGVYTVTITDAIAQQTVMQNVTITQPAPISAVPTVTNVACFGNATGAISLFVIGGTAGYTYLWENGAMTSTRSGLVQGTYSCVITDSRGCSKSISQAITQPTSALSAFTQAIDADCFGTPTGTIFLTASGGTAGYTYLWNDGSGQKDRVNIAAGAYSCTVTDAKGCTTTVSATISQPAAALAVSAATVSPVCTSANGSISLTPSGGTAGYSFNWGGGITSQNRTGLVAGTYSATVTDANGCTKTISQTLVSAPSAMAATTTSTNVACFGVPNGTINLSISNGVSPLTFNWGGGIVSQNRTGLAAGIYTVTATDANGCSTTTSKTITQPAAALATTAAAQNVACFGNTTGAISLASTGGTAPFSYNWGGGVVSQNRTGLAAGTYSATISDSNGCETTVSSIVTQPSAALAASAATSDVDCFGNATGSISLGVSGGTAGFSFDWGGGVTTQNRSNLTAGTYSATITDANGCTTSIQKTISQPMAALVAATSATDVLCNGSANGTAIASATGGNGGFTFLWTNGATTATVSNLAAGTFNVSVSDSKNCLSTASVSIAQPAVFACAATATAQSANNVNDGTATATTTGGTADYAFLWSNGQTTASISGLAPGVYSVVATDANGCTAGQTVTVNAVGCALNSSISGSNSTCFGANNGSAAVTLTGATAPISYLWSNGATTAAVSGLAPGSYLVGVLDGGGCPAALNISISEPTVLTASAISSDETAAGTNDGTASANPTGGTAGYVFLWSNGATTATISGLAPATYSVVVTDANGCSATQSVIVSPFGCVLTATFSTQNVTCSGAANGQITLTPSGNGPFSYAWSNGQTTKNATNLSGGSFSVIISDGSCSLTVNANITEPTLLTASLSSQTNVVCPNDANGTATISTAGGTAPIAILWTSGATSATATGLLPGNYSAQITDANGCSATVAATVAAVDNIAPIVTCPANISQCFDQKTVDYVFPEASDNCPLLNGTWAVVSGLASGATFPVGLTKQTFTFTDASGNVGSCSFDIKISSAATVGSFAITGCFQNCLGSIAASGTSGGLAPYIYNWSNGQTGTSISGLCATNTGLVITDAAGCATTQIFNIIQPPLLTIAAPIVVNDANGQNVGSISINVAGGLAPFSFKWTKNGNAFSTSEDLTGLGAGLYTVVVTDANGCTVSVQNIDVSNIVGTSEPDWATGMKMLPNPTDGLVQLLFSTVLTSEMEVSVFDATGRLMAETASTDQSIELNLGHLPDGIYSIRMRSEKGQGTRMLVIQH